MADFLLLFDLRPCDRLDQFALLACQDYNLGNRGDWFGCFRGGLHGFYARIWAVRKHYYEVHAWIPAPRILADAEYHLASIFFNMDSAIECLTFAINAFGSSVAVSEFRDVTDERTLRLVSLLDILGDPSRTPPIQPLPGHRKYFPRLQELWQNHRDLLKQIADQHDVSKHRETIFQGGQLRDDPPPGFYKALGVAEDHKRRWQYQPMAEIILHPSPKSPRVTRGSVPVADQIRLESTADAFCELINESARCVLADAQTTIIFPHQDFIH
jgi:hypothetical protein